MKRSPQRTVTVADHAALAQVAAAHRLLTARSIAHRFARLIQQAVLTPPTTYRDIAGRAT